MATANSKVKETKTTIKALTRAFDKNMNEKITVYEFSNGRKFKELQRKPSGY